MLQTLQTLLHEAFLSNLRELLVQRRQKRHCIAPVYLYNNLLVCCFFLLYFVRNLFVFLSQTLLALRCVFSFLFFFGITEQEHASHQRLNERGVKEKHKTNKQMMEGEAEKHIAHRRCKRRTPSHQEHELTGHNERR